MNCEETPNEYKIQREILSYLKKLNSGYWFKVVRSNKIGVPDICGVYNGFSVFIEVKSKIGKLSKLQKYSGEIIKNNGGYFIVARSVKHVEKLLKKLDKKI